MALIPVPWVGGALRSVVPGAPASTRTLTGTFEWTETTANTYLSANFDYALLQITVQRGGQYQLDDYTLSSVEEAPRTFPPRRWDRSTWRSSFTSRMSSR